MPTQKVRAGRAEWTFPFPKSNFISLEDRNLLSLLSLTVSSCLPSLSVTVTAIRIDSTDWLHYLARHCTAFLLHIWSLSSTSRKLRVAILILYSANPDISRPDSNDIMEFCFTSLLSSPASSSFGHVSRITCMHKIQFRFPLLVQYAKEFESHTKEQFGMEKARAGQRTDNLNLHCAENLHSHMLRYATSTWAGLGYHSQARHYNNMGNVKTIISSIPLFTCTTHACGCGGLAVRSFGYFQSMCHIHYPRLKGTYSLMKWNSTKTFTTTRPGLAE